MIVVDTSAIVAVLFGDAVDDELAKAAIVSWRRFGNGRHPAGLNFGDTFSYALSRRLGQPLLFVGDDFLHTDVTVP